jgi:hypothetical protein
MGGEEKNLAWPTWRGDGLSGWDVRSAMVLVGKFVKKDKCSGSFVKK